MKPRIFPGGRLFRSAVGKETHRALFQNHPTTMWIHDPVNSEFLDLKSAAAGEYGYTHEELIKMEASIFSERM